MNLMMVLVAAFAVPCLAAVDLSYAYDANGRIIEKIDRATPPSVITLVMENRQQKTMPLEHAILMI